MDPIQLSPVGLLQSSESKRRSPPAALQQVSEHSIHCQWKGPTSEQVSLCQAPLFCSRTNAHAGRGAGRNPSQSIAASGEQLLAHVLHPALYGTGGNADRQGQGQEMRRGWGFAEILARRPQICSPFRGPSRTPVSQRWQHKQVTAPGSPWVLRCNRYPGNPNKRGGNACYWKHY